MPMADIKGPSFVRRSPASSRRSTLRSSSDPTPPKGSWCCPNAGWWKEPWRGSGDAAGWPRTGNVSTTRRAHSCSSPRSALWSEGYAAPNYVSGQTLRGEPQAVPCIGGYKYFYLDWNLDIWRCEAWNEPLGSVFDLDRIADRRDPCNACMMACYRNASMLMHAAIAT